MSLPLCFIVTVKHILTLSYSVPNQCIQLTILDYFVTATGKLANIQLVQITKVPVTKALSYKYQPININSVISVPTPILSFGSRFLPPMTTSSNVKTDRIQRKVIP